MSPPHGGRKARIKRVGGFPLCGNTPHTLAHTRLIQPTEYQMILFRKRIISAPRLENGAIALNVK